MKCVVTGGAGFIGSNLAEGLLRKNYNVTVIDDLSTGNRNNIKEFEDKINFIKGNVLDLGLLQEAFNGCDFIFHQAAIPSVTKSIVSPKATSEVNIMGTLNVLIAARDNKVKKVICASSSSVYGDTKVLPKKEIMLLSPKSPYALSKLVCEQYCKQFYKHYGLHTVCLRYFNVFGPKQDANSEYAAVIPKFINCLLKNLSPIIFSDGTQTRDFTYVKDVVKANILAAHSNVTDGTSINIAYNKNVSINELLALLNSSLDKNIKAVYKEARVGDIKDSLADISLAKKLLNYNPDYSLHTGLKETIEWFKDK